MQFFSVAFLLFLGLSAVAYAFCPRGGRAWFLLIASYAFYCTWDVSMAAVLLGITVAVFATGLALDRWRGSVAAGRLMVTAVSALTIYLAFFKAERLVRHGNLLIPLGVSY